MNREDVVNGGQKLGLPAALVNTIGEYVNDPQPRSRGFIVPALMPSGDTVDMPGVPYLSTEPVFSQYDRPAPVLGAVTADEVLVGWQSEPRQASEPGPLSKVRVICFGTAIAGAFAGATLGDLGADVVKIESPGRPDNIRRIWMPPEPPTKEPSGADTSFMFQNLNRSERSLSMDMKKPAAVELLLRLVAEADIVIDNFGPAVMDSWGLGSERLAAANPRLIQISLTGFGHTEGPRSHYLAYGSTVSSFTGLTQAWGRSHGTHFDYISQAHGVLAALAALAARDQTGRGTVIDLAEVEVAGAMMAPLVLDYTANGVDSEPVGNRVAGAIYSDVLACKGADRWLAIEIENEADWTALTSLLGLSATPLPAEGGDIDEVALGAGRLAQHPPAAAGRAPVAGARDRGRSGARCRGSLP